MRRHIPNTIWDPKWAGTGRNILYKMYTLENDKRVYHYLAIKWKGHISALLGGWIALIMKFFSFSLVSTPFWIPFLCYLAWPIKHCLKL